MLFYLDNNSNQVAGPNENYARELFELHTLGAGNYFGVQDPRKPGLQNEQLYDRADLAVTIDYRQALSEIVVRRLSNAHLSAVFPGYKDYQPLGIVRGTDLQLEA
jgi:hypothetical protein